MTGAIDFVHEREIWALGGLSAHLKVVVSLRVVGP